MKFDMGAQTLSTLTKNTDASHQDLGALVRQLAVAADPLLSNMGGAAAEAFFSFKDRSDQIATDLNSSLAAILGGQQGMDVAFTTGDQTMAANATQVQGQANFDGARFGSSRA